MGYVYMLGRHGVSHVKDMLGCYYVMAKQSAR